MSKLAIIIAGLNYGDEGKGSTVDFLTREFNAHTVIRYNGGAQAAHHVVTPEGITHCFAQFGSGTCIPGTKTYLSKHMLINPIDLHNEHEALCRNGIKDAYDRLFIDEKALIITPFHRYLNRVREIGRGQNPHGSCGQGIWETHKHALDYPDEAIHAADLLNGDALRSKLQQLGHRISGKIEEIIPKIHVDREEAQQYLMDVNDPDFLDLTVSQLLFDIGFLQIVSQYELKALLDQQGTVIFEGAQGVLLDAWHGFFPYVTGTDTTLKHADQLLAECGYEGEVIRLGILRAYMTRHGAGPFVTEDHNLTMLLPDVHNKEERWQGGFRLGWFDLIATRYAIDLAGPLDGLVITGLDRLAGFKTIQTCIAYFSHELEVISRLVVNRSASREQQTELTQVMMIAKPFYQHYPLLNGGIDSYAFWLADQLGVALFATSAGPTVQDKKFINPAFQKKAGFFMLDSELRIC